MIVVEDLIVREHSVICDQTVYIDVFLQCNIPEAIHCDTVSLSIHPHAFIKQTVSGKKLLCKADSGGMLKEQVPNFNPIKKPVPSHIEVKAHTESSSSAIVCVNTQDLLRRTDSTKNYRRESQQVKEDFSEALVLEEVELTPGKNVLNLSKQVTKSQFSRIHMNFSMCLCFSENFISKMICHYTFLTIKLKLDPLIHSMTCISLHKRYR